MSYARGLMKIILFQPQIPQNAGNIVRTCAVTGASLAMVRPLGFSTSDRWLKRSGLDYWEGVDVSFIDDLDAYLTEQGGSFYFFSSKATQLYSSVAYMQTLHSFSVPKQPAFPQSFLKNGPNVLSPCR